VAAARAVVNAAGPWVDRVRRLGDRSAGTSVGLGKGVHLVLEAPPGWHAANICARVTELLSYDAAAVAGR
jgi:glycerol-3-phosphate dehydrogenase